MEVSELDFVNAFHEHSIGGIISATYTVPVMIRRRIRLQPIVALVLLLGATRSFFIFNFTFW